MPKGTKSKCLRRPGSTITCSMAYHTGQPSVALNFLLSCSPILSQQSNLPAEEQRAHLTDMFAQASLETCLKQLNMKRLKKDQILSHVSLLLLQHQTMEPQSYFSPRLRVTHAGWVGSANCWTFEALGEQAGSRTNL